MRLWQRILFYALLAAIVTGITQSAFADDSKPSQLSTQAFKPSSYLRDIFDAQVQMANGGSVASTAHAEAQRRAVEAFLAADVGVWNNPSDMTTLLVFTLTGGDAIVLHKVVASRVQANALKTLTDGVMALTRAEPGKAVELLLPLRNKIQHPVLAAAVAFSIAPIVQETDPNLALVLYDETRLEAPGTLLEEAALRRKINVYLDQGQPLLAMAILRLHFRRFPASPYAKAIIERAANGISHALKGESPSGFAAVVQTFKDSPGENAAQLLLDLSRELLLAGEFQKARDTLASLPMRLASLDGAARAAIYRLTLKFGSSTATELEAELGKIDRTQLSEKDAAFIDVAQQIAVRSPSYEPSDAEAKQLAGRNVPASVPQPELTATRQRGKQALEDAEAVLQLEGRP